MESWLAVEAEGKANGVTSMFLLVCRQQASSPQNHAKEQRI